MRSAAAALAAVGLLLIAAGCGSSNASITQTSSGADAASLVPASALAYVSADANLDSQQWQVLTDVFGPLPSKLDYKNDIHPALGDRVNLAVLGIDNGQPEAVALVQPTDEAAAQIGQVVEGLTTAPVLRDLSHRVGVELPITEGVCRVLGGESLDVLLANLMGRQPTAE